jgi:hypothetical protein
MRSGIRSTAARSAAAPLAASCAALLKQKHPGATPESIELALPLLIWLRRRRAS